MTSNRERTLQLFQSGLQNHTSVKDILQRNSLAGTPQFTDFCFYDVLLVHRILK